MRHKTKKTKNRIKGLYIAFIVAIAVVGALLAVAIWLYFDKNGSLPLVRTEIMYVIAALALLLPVLLVLLLIYVIMNRRRGGRTINIVTSNPVKISGAQNESCSAEAGSSAQPVKSAGAQPATAEKPAATAVRASGGVSRFDGLSRIDRERAKYVREGYDEHITLRTLCERFRNFSAGKLKLYYSISDIRRFISGLLVSHIMILQGMSGTGKTSLAYAFGEFLDNPSTVVPVQPMWKERTDLIGYYNEFTKRFNETDLLKKMYEAGYSKDIYITVLDEMNIARVEYYFAEFLSLLELPDPDERELTVVSDKWDTDPVQLRGGHILLPENMWFIGTANNDDSTFAISDKVYDRAMIMDLDSKAEIFAAEESEKLHITAKRFCELGEEAQREYEITRRNLKRLEKMDEFMKANFRITFGNRIMKQIKAYVPVYIACGGDELEALDDILSKKVMRKLGMQNPVYIRNQADRFCQYMDELFGEDRMKQCKAVVQRLKLNA